MYQLMDFYYICIHFFFYNTYYLLMFWYTNIYDLYFIYINNLYIHKHNGLYKTNVHIQNYKRITFNSILWKTFMKKKKEITEVYLDEMHGNNIWNLHGLCFLKHHKNIHFNIQKLTENSPKIYLKQIFLPFWISWSF